MKVTNEQLKKIYFGAYRYTETKDGYLQSYQFDEEQTEIFKKQSDFWYERCNACNSKTLEFVTKANKVSFDYKMLWIGSKDTVEAYVNGRLVQIHYIKNLKKSGRIEFDLSSKAIDSKPSEKNVIIYLPADATMGIKNFEIDGKYTPAVKGEKVLWLGDSITQGYGTFRSSHTYVSVANRSLNYDIINQGVGGYVYDKTILKKMEGYNPDKIIVSLGTNQFGTKSMKDIKAYYEVLTKLYKGKKILCITPLWRADVPDSIDTLIRFCNKLKDIAKEYKNIKIVDGFEMVPHLPEYYLDLLHPNALGGEIYGRNLVNEIKRLGF